MTREMDHRFEKYAVIAVARWFRENGYEVGISVPGSPRELVQRDALSGLEIPSITENDLLNPKHRYEVYYDTPGCIDLVARNNEEVWLIEAKGITEGGSAPGSVAQAVGRVVLLMTSAETRLRYAMVVPRQESFLNALRSIAPDNPVLTRDDFRVFLVSKDGSVECRSVIQLLGS